MKLKLTSFFLAGLMAAKVSAQESPPPEKPLVPLICVIVVGGIILTIGGCAARKLINKPPRTFPDDTDPPHPPPSTNAPPHTLAGSNLVGYLMPAAGAGEMNCAMIKWDITGTTNWLGDTNSYRNTVTGSRYTHIITATIMGSDDLQHWSVVGSRMIWWSDQDQTSLINYYDPNGVVVATRYVPKSELGQAPPNSDSRVPLEPWEIGNEPMHFYRLASPVDHIGVLTQ